MFPSDERVQIVGHFLATMNTWSNDNLLGVPSESSKEEKVMKYMTK